jgi:methylene-fatty-acyl-phospholipid synthase
VPEHLAGVLRWSAVLLSVERVFYIWVARAPEQARSLLPNLDPVRVIECLFYGFKVLQLAVFVWWSSAFGQEFQASQHSPAALALGIAAIVVGQTLSTSVFLRLGRVGVFYGAEFGRDVSKTREFPFSLCAHPQYVGAVLSIWGLFLIVRFPSEDWWVLPALETAYYAIGARLERGAQPTRRTDASVES